MIGRGCGVACPRPNSAGPPLEAGDIARQAQPPSRPLEPLIGDPPFTPEAVRALLIAAAREGRPVSYSELLADLGHRFTRPRMRALCKLLDKVDEAGATAGEPELAVLVVRESDGLPGQGWWAARADALGHEGDWTGPDAKALVRELQGAAFDFWGKTKG